METINDLSKIYLLMDIKRLQDACVEIEKDPGVKGSYKALLLEGLHAEIDKIRQEIKSQLK